MARLLELMVRKISMVSVLSLDWIFCGTQDWNKKRELYDDTNGKLHPFAAAHFLAQVRNDVQLQKLLKMACSVNITHEGHYLALEIYSVKFIKQNITGNVVDDETLKTKIKAAQSE